MPTITRDKGHATMPDDDHHQSGGHPMRVGGQTVNLRRDGPTLEQYVETRLALLTELLNRQQEYLEKRFVLLNEERAQMIVALQERMDKIGGSVNERIEKTVALREALQKSIDQRFEHIERTNALVNDASTRAIDKAEAAQLAHNIAANEWRGTLNDLSSRLIARPEFNRLSDDFAAYKLESARLFSATVAEKGITKEVKEDTRAVWAIIIAIVFGIMSFVGTILVLFVRH